MAGLAIGLVLAVGVATGVIFAISPALDLRISSLVFAPGMRGDDVQGATLHLLREFHLKAFLVIMVVAGGALALRLLFAKVPMLLPARGAWLILLTFLIGPGLLANAVLKEHWSRPRPAQVTQFGGAHDFKPWWDPTGTCKRNCSFVSGEASAGFAVLAIAVLAPIGWRIRAVGLALAYGLFVGGLRVVVGGHFATDVIFAGVLTAAVVWLLHGLIYRWPATSISEAEAEARIDAIRRRVRAWSAAAFGRIPSYRGLRARLQTARSKPATAQLEGRPTA